MDLKEIKSGVGLGNIKFGMTRSQVKVILGEPSEIEKFSYSETDEDLTESWHYDELDLSAGFDEDVDWRLVTLAVSSPDYEFMGKKLIGLDSDELLSALAALANSIVPICANFRVGVWTTVRLLTGHLSQSSYRPICCQRVSIWNNNLTIRDVKAWWIGAR